MFCVKKEEVVKVIKTYPVNKLVFWLGAGIDLDFPTALPLGRELTVDVLKRGCGSEYAENILAQWKKSRQLISDVTGGNIDIHELPRLETILEAVRIFEENLLSDNSILKGLESFSEAPANENHFVLAELLHEGANIVTTNFDECIVKAYNELYQDENLPLTLHQEKETWIYESELQEAGKIYHIHGVARCIENIGATLSILKNPIAGEFDNKMKKWLDDGSCFIFLGYSGMDSLDVIPYLNKLESSEKSIGVYVRHTEQNIEDENVQSNEREDVLLKCFQAKYLVCFNTAQLFY